MTRISALLNRPGPTPSSVFLAAALWLNMASPSVAGGHNASVILYHRFGEEDYPATNVSIEQFESHLVELQSGGYAVVSLPDIVKALKTGKPLPEKAVALTVDDAYLSVYTEAWPRLRKLGYPLTVFVATDPVDGGFKRYMSWEQIRELQEEGVTIGNQTAGHLHMAASGETRNRSDLEKSNNRFEKELGETPNLIAYPYGETSMAVVNLVKDMGFIAGFGQHSGAIGPSEPLYYLPRFSMNENFGDLKRFKTAAGALSLPHRDFTPEDPTIAKDRNPPLIGFTLEKSVANGSINCYASHQDGPARMERLGGERVEIRLDKPLPTGRSRLNCTRLGPNGRWYWLGRQFFVPG